MLQIQNITFAYKRGVNVLKDFALTLTRGGVYGLLGSNGAGKSTLLYLISGLLTPGKGHVFFNDVDTRRRLPSTLADIFIVPEEFSLPPIDLNDYIELYGQMYPRFSRDDMERYLDMFEMHAPINLGALSMGQKKKVFMSFALACNTRLLLMDEPSNGLDIPGKSMFRRAISAAAGHDRIIIISTHQVRDIDRILDHILILDHSQILLDESVERIIEKLSFGVTADPDDMAAALYSQPSVDGMAIVTRNTGGMETELNLESLFGFALGQPAKIAEIFAESDDGRLSNTIES